MEAAELKKMIEKKADFFLLDVRTKQEVDFTRIKGSVHVPINELQDRADELPKEKKIVVYCHSGGRSAYATAFLRNKGFDAENLEGGIDEYADLDKSIKVY
ncbi:MAG: rhodanese-like domain-containing protein [Candidatus Woesearchaeota archaeon]|nr:rhodanese-like domain-containing protein [Candidatus Woesearchaeota archaeon]